MNAACSTRVAARWLRSRMPARTIRLRLTVVYGGLFLCSAATLLAITYVLVRHQYTGSFFISSGRQAVVSITRPGGLGDTVHVQKGSVLGPAVPVGTNVIAFDPRVVQAAARSQSTAALNQLLVDSGIALAIMAVLSLWLGWVIAGRALRPLRTITNAAREISASNLHRRLALEGPDDELMQLGTTFDSLLARLEGSFDAQRQFVANASHELRTPLTLERTLLELALSDPDPSIDSYRHTCEQLLVVGERQEDLIEALLTLSRSQRGLHSRHPVDLAAIAGAAATAADHGELDFDSDLRPAETSGDPRLVERLVANLVSNAVRHNTAGGRVEIATGTRGGRAVVTVANTGPAVPPAELARIFEPFERLEASRTVDGNGLGLGLSIVKAIAVAHDAVLTAEARAGGGLEVQVAFLAAAPRVDDRSAR
jgi:signal transduction histidine kinase